MASHYHTCYHCKNRTYNCHSICQLYIEEKQEMEKQRKERNRKLENTIAINDLKENRVLNKGNRQHKVYRTHKR